MNKEMFFHTVGYFLVINTLFVFIISPENKLFKLSYIVNLCVMIAFSIFEIWFSEVNYD